MKRFLRLFAEFRELEESCDDWRKRADELLFERATLRSQLDEVRQDLAATQQVIEQIRVERDEARVGEMLAMKRNQDWQAICNGYPQIWGTIPEPPRPHPEDVAGEPRGERVQIREAIAKGNLQFFQELEEQVSRDWERQNGQV